MSTLALGFHKIRGAWPRPPSLGLRPIHLVSPDFMKVGAIAPTFYLMRVWREGLFLQPQGRENGGSRARTAYYILWCAVPGKKWFFPQASTGKPQDFPQLGTYPQPLVPTVHRKEKQNFRECDKKKHPFPTKLPKSAEPLDRRGQSRYNRMHKHNIWCVFSENATKFCDRRKAVFVWKREMAT